MHIIIQAGGKGTRLEGLTRNKPKCLVPVQNLPLIFHVFERFKNDDFTIIADYKTEVLERYLQAFAAAYKWRIVRAEKKGTAAGVAQACEAFGTQEPFLLLWCDLMLPENLCIPTQGNWVGISKDFECRWSYVNGQFVESPSKADGVAGLFVFENKQCLKDVPAEGGFVEWLSTQRMGFERLDLTGGKEIGTLLSYADQNPSGPRCRPFNQVEFHGDETAWYQHVQALGYPFIPHIYSYKPLQMKRVRGKNIFEYDCLTSSQKREILRCLIEALHTLHTLDLPRPACEKDSEACYLEKTFSRLEKVRRLVPFANQEFIKINGQYYKNVFFNREELSAAVREHYAKEFVLIHGDCTFSNLMFDTYDMRAVLIDPRGYFGTSKLYGDADYDWAKLYYSLKGEYDQFNRKKFTLDIQAQSVELAIKPNNWADMEEYFFELLPQVNKRKLKLLHGLVWLSLTTYAWEDYDSICGAFYNGLIRLGEVL